MRVCVCVRAQSDEPINDSWGMKSGKKREEGKRSVLPSRIFHGRKLQI